MKIKPLTLTQKKTPSYSPCSGGSDLAQVEPSILLWQFILNTPYPISIMRSLRDYILFCFNQQLAFM